MTDDHMRSFAKEIFETFKDCREDMHEPDEQGWRIAKISGMVLDNSGLDREQHLTVYNEDGSRITMNICDVLALARVGAKTILTKEN
jgi:hypothetical protein